MEAADRLFYQKGIRAVGVDTVAAEAGISKRSLYDTFPSKDALVAAYLRQRIQPLPASDQPPAMQVLALFDQLRARFAKGDFRGCPFPHRRDSGTRCRRGADASRRRGDAFQRR